LIKWFPEKHTKGFFIQPDGVEKENITLTGIKIKKPHMGFFVLAELML